MQNSCPSKDRFSFYNSKSCLLGSVRYDGELFFSIAALVCNKTYQPWGTSIFFKIWSSFHDSKNSSVSITNIMLSTCSLVIFKESERGDFSLVTYRTNTIYPLGRPLDCRVSGTMHNWSKMYSLCAFDCVNPIHYGHTTIVVWNFDQRRRLWGVDFSVYAITAHYWHNMLGYTCQWDILLVRAAVLSSLGHVSLVVIISFLGLSVNRVSG